ncbi:MAG: molybdenum cofactor guanylyltransferase MobA [Nevskiales bacterium]
MPRISDITGLILAGGRSSRMGRDKGLLTLHGRRLIEHVLIHLRSQVSAALISANDNLDAYSTYGVPVIPDLRADFCGPLAGIEAGLTSAKTDWLLCVPCDATHLPSDLVVRMRMQLEETDAELCAVENPDGLLPVCCLVPKRLLPDLNVYLDLGERGVGGWLRRHKLATVNYQHWPARYWSVNTPRELAVLEQDEVLWGADTGSEHGQVGAGGDQAPTSQIVTAPLAPASAPILRNTVSRAP